MSMAKALGGRVMPCGTVVLVVGPVPAGWLCAGRLPATSDRHLEEHGLAHLDGCSGEDVCGSAVCT